MAEVETRSSMLEAQRMSSPSLPETVVEDMMSSPYSKTPNTSRPSSQQPRSPSDSDSGSDYSQPETPNASQPSSMRPQSDISTTATDFEDVSLDSRPASKMPRVSSTTPFPELQQFDELDHEPLDEETSMAESAGQLHLDESADYLDSPSQSEESPSTPTVPVSPATPQEAHMSVQSFNLSEADADYEYGQQSAEPSEDVMATPKPRESKHLRKPSSLEILHNAWNSAWSLPRRRPTLTRPAPPTRQSTLFDMMKEEPETPKTATSGQDQEVEEMNDVVAAEADANSDEANQMNPRQSSRLSVTAIDPSSIWRMARWSSLGAPTQIITPPDTSEEDEQECDEEEPGEQLDWHTLDKTEEQEKEDKDLPKGVEDESTRFLLARLEQENAKFTADPKSSTGALNKQIGRVRSQTRPPSMAHLKKLVSQQDSPSIRYSLVPEAQNQLPDEPPPMTELEFWTALVQDYPSTASRLPTLTTTKIRAGIPPPLRGVVWTSMAGARDKALEEAFDNLQDEKSPYEGIINKDVGRSFPGVELFRDADGEGQKMLGRVLKCFSLHDKDIGYCQGLGFLVGPLLMNMGEKEAFCVLVRLMDHYALRPSFLPSLSGLHMRIFQFSSLLQQHHPKLSEHLTSLGVEPAYLSQWFLSCFAVTCPLPMLFRIYDVIFAEGANETVMRVALALFRRNEEKMLESTEFEEVMQLLLGRALWDVYGCNADELVDDFTSLGNIITHARLAELEKEYETKDGESVGQSAGFLPDVQAAASRFLGRLWAPNHASTPSKGASTTLSPHSADKDGSVLHRSPSKQSLTAINYSSSSESSTSSGSGSSTSTAPTDSEVHDAAARESHADSMSMKSKSESVLTISGSTSAHAQHLSSTSGAKEQELQTEIEDLLMALSEMQREHAQMAAMLQREREERSDDHRVVRQLLTKLTNGESRPKTSERRSMPPPPRPQSAEVNEISIADKRKTLPPRPQIQIPGSPVTARKVPVVEEEHKDEIEALVDNVQSRLDSNGRFSASLETKAQLRATLSRTREQLATAEAQVKDLSERAEFTETSLNTFQGESESLRSEVEELRTRVNDDFKEKKKLELTIENLRIQMRMEAKAIEKKQRNTGPTRAESSGDVPTIKRLEAPGRSRSGSSSSNASGVSGLRELKLARRDSSNSVASIRTMKSQRQASELPPSSPPPPVQVSASPDVGSPIEAGPPSPTAPFGLPTVPQSSSLTVPAPTGPQFSRRTTSLAAKEVFSTPAHEPVPDEALLLELVNAKTAEATARQELDELKKAMQMQKRRAEESLLEFEASIASANMETEKARGDAEKAREEAKAARAEIFDASPLRTPMMSEPVTPVVENESTNAETLPVTTSPSPVEKTEPKEPESASSRLGGWLWGRRAGSTTKATTEKAIAEEK